MKKTEKFIVLRNKETGLFYRNMKTTNELWPIVQIGLTTCETLQTIA